ncbi:hypothetical protein ACUOA8_62940, partial [Escherichia sp. SS-MK2]
LFGQAEILTLDLASEGSPHARQASEIRQHVLNTTRLVNNLLDMARIQSGSSICSALPTTSSSVNHSFF